MKIGAVIQLAEHPFLKQAMSYSQIQYTAARCEDLGLDSIWVYDHLLYREKKGITTGIWEGWSILSALAATTKRMELGTLVACNSFRSPALLAKMAYTVDEISIGRLVLGVGAGWNQPEYDAWGHPPACRRQPAAHAQACCTARRSMECMLHDHPAFDRNHAARDVESLQSGWSRPPHPKIYIPGQPGLSRLTRLEEREETRLPERVRRGNRCSTGGV